MVNPSLDISHIIFEKGLELQRENGNWSSTSNCYKPAQVSPPQITKMYNIRPVVLTVELPVAGSKSFLAPISKGRLLEIDMADLTQIAPFQDHRFIMWNLDLSYTVGAVIHHCHMLAKSYVEVCRDFSHLPSPSRKMPRPCVFGDQPEPYYAFEALITAAIRFYMAARRPIWAAFGLGESTPNSFERVVARCTNLPDILRNELQLNLDKYGSKLKQYRDCIEHYVHLGGPIPPAFMEQLDNGLWLARFRIPDNPEARSANAFRYDSQLDALTYGWAVTDEVVRLARVIIEGLPKE